MLPLDTKYLQRLVESSPDMIIAVDREGVITYYNDGARQNLGYAPEEVIGKPCAESIYPSLEEARRVMRAMRESPNGNRIASFETAFRNKAGQTIPGGDLGRAYHDDHGNEIGSIGFARDIRRMRLHQQLATAGEIAVSLAHEINNPLESITERPRSRYPRDGLPSERVGEVVENERVDSIRGSIERVQAIVRRLDEMAREGVYETRDYLAGKRMADLAPREIRAKTAAARTRAGAGRDTAADRGFAAGRDVGSRARRRSGGGKFTRRRAARREMRSALRDAPSAALGILRNVKVDAVISDVVMPEMDGYDFYMTVKGEMPELPVILMTAYYYDKDHIMKRARLRGPRRRDLQKASQSAEAPPDARAAKAESKSRQDRSRSSRPETCRAEWLIASDYSVVLA